MAWLASCLIAVCVGTACTPRTEPVAPTPQARPAEIPRPMAGATPPDPEKPPAAASALDFETHVTNLRKRLAREQPGTAFHIVVEPPFVVVGDQSPREVQRWATNTIAWAVRLLKKDFFESDPDHVIDVWLFRSRGSYTKHTRELFGDRPSTPFGYYSPRHRALIMNISTGGGTLVHEIVHPFVAANFPECPSWLNEGLGSLYEQCNERDGKIVGMTNWRLKGLKEAIRADRLPNLETLTGTTEAQFYDGDHAATNYAHARYLCYWLQQHDKLRQFWREFRKSHQRDPTGYATLVRVIDERDIEAFEERWQAWCLGLVFRG